MIPPGAHNSAPGGLINVGWLGQAQMLPLLGIINIEVSTTKVWFSTLVPRPQNLDYPARYVQGHAAKQDWCDLGE